MVGQQLLDFLGCIFICYYFCKPWVFKCFRVRNLTLFPNINEFVSTPQQLTAADPYNIFITSLSVSVSDAYPDLTFRNKMEKKKNCFAIFFPNPSIVLDLGKENIGKTEVLCYDDEKRYSKNSLGCATLVFPPGLASELPRPRRCVESSGTPGPGPASWPPLSTWPRSQSPPAGPACTTEGRKKWKMQCNEIGPVFRIRIQGLHKKT